MNLSSDISSFRNDSKSAAGQILLSLSNDSALWQEFKKGSKEAFAVIYHKNFNDLYNYGLKICSDENIVKDCLQELFTNIWLSKERLSEVKVIKFYSIKSFRRDLIHVIKKSKKENFSLTLFTQSQPDILFSSEELMLAEESLNIRKERLARILNGLPKRRKEAIYLRYYRELTYEEIALVMNLTEKAVINHVYKAFKSIKKNIKSSSNFNMLLG